jgi:hypothetical protein
MSHFKLNYAERLFASCIIAIFFLSGITSALEAPYLISTVALTDSSIAFSYRNNDIETQGFWIYQKAVEDSVFSFIGSAQLGPLVYIARGLLPFKKYYFAVKAVNSTDTSDFSNIDSAVTKELERVFKLPAIRTVWDIKAQQAIVHFSDSSNCETGFKMLVSEKFSAFQVKQSIVSLHPKTMSDTVWKCSSIKLNEWYDFEIIMFDSTDSIVSLPTRLYTFDAQDLINRYPRIYLKEKVSDFPILLNGWAMKNGNDIMLTEKNASASLYTIIDVSDINKPAFAGYKTSAQPVFDASAVLNSSFNWKDYPYSTRYVSKGHYLYCCKDSSISVYNYQDTDFILKSTLPKICLDTLKFSYWGTGTKIFYNALQNWFNDTTIAIWFKESSFECPSKLFSFIAVKKDTLKNIIFNKTQDIPPQYGFSYSKTIGTLFKCFNIFKGIYFADSKIISLKNGINETPSSISIADYSISYTNPVTINYNGKSNSDFTGESDSLNDYISLDAQKLSTVQYVGKYLISEPKLPPINYSFLDSTNKTLFLVLDTVLSIYRYDTVPPNGIINFKSNKHVVINNTEKHFTILNQSNSNIELSFTRPIRNLRISLYSISGQLVNTHTFNNSCNAAIDISGITSGVYYLHAIIDGNSQMVRINKIKGL